MSVKANPNNANKRKWDDGGKPAAPHKPSNNKPKGKGKGKSKRKGRGPNVPRELVGKALETADGKRICWPFNMMPTWCSRVRRAWMRQKP